MITQIEAQFGTKARKTSVLFVGLLTAGLALPVQAFLANVASAQNAENTDSPAANEALAQTSAQTPARETLCTDGTDDDNDGLRDCADADCFDDRACRAGGSEERTEAACTDWIDNDGDGAVDCDDDDCKLDSIRACQGSYRNPAAASSTAAAAQSDDQLPELGENMSVEDLIGRGGDIDGERSDELCSDGVDNDNDGRTDCADFGCRFDPQVNVCRGTPGLRFSFVGGLGGRVQWNYNNPGNNLGGNYMGNTPEAGFTLLQLRALGPIPFIQNSFFLINMRADDRVRITFVNFQLPISSRGHYLSLNSGFGTLSTALIISAARRTLLEAPFYMTSAFEQGNGASVEVGGPIDEAGQFRFRLFGAAGAGEFNGNVGGRFFRSDDRNFTWTAGAQGQINLVGRYDRFDTPFLYTPVPLTAAILLGGKYDQRATERFVAGHAQAIVRGGHFLLSAENFWRYVLDYEGLQTAWNVTASVLLIPRTLMLAADVGGFFRAMNYRQAISADAQVPQEQYQFRAALHYYYFRDVAMLTALYRETHNEEANPTDLSIEREVRLETRFRF